MNYGICCTTAMGFSPTAQDVLRFARLAEEVGFHSIVVADHVLTPKGFDSAAYPAGVFEPRTPWYDPLVFLAAIAGVTHRIRLGTGIIVVPYRSPIQQAQAVATLDFISGGRFFYGAGIGWMRDEFDALGIPFSERGRRTDEYLEVMKLLWSGSAETYNGAYVQFGGGSLNPLPVQRPHPPVLIGGESAPALRRIAKYGDGFYINWKSADEFDAILHQLDANMAENGKSAKNLYMQMGVTDLSILSQSRRQIPAYAAMGLNEIILNPKCASVDEGIEVMQDFAREYF